MHSIFSTGAISSRRSCKRRVPPGRSHIHFKTGLIYAYALFLIGKPETSIWTLTRCGRRPLVLRSALTRRYTSPHPETVIREGLRPYSIDLSTAEGSWPLETV